MLQTSYLEILDGRARFGGRAGFKTFVFAVIRRVAASRRRRRSVRALLLGRFAAEAGSVGALIAAAPDPAHASETEDRARRVRAAVASLAPRQREVLDLVFFHGLTVDQAAEVMRVSVGSARVHYHRGKERLLALLGELAP